ncbi:hypothetical protein HXP44_06055 [Streptomyces sioyaensis]|uniref:Uncharacterized protein n=1 Tax=Streptomyces sioyaensis TaxID=67364 RepID=A0A4Q1R787_9ACTN|nr:hypothetical protein [Streptomyces sioyaensis]MBM4791636.1 hypothetical protein [Streptomyces sioyaensis]RXS69184.1 hypothetical protein EST54_06960 [Streptomyces sioyaensis]
MPTPTRRSPHGPARTGAATPPSGTTAASDDPAPSPGKGTIAGLYLVAGLVMGGVWAWNQGSPLWEHAVKLLVLLFVAAPLLHRARSRRAARRPARRLQLSFVRLAAAKIALVALAIGASWLLEDSMRHPDLAVAAGLTSVITVLGPLLHRYLLVRSPTAVP